MCQDAIVHLVLRLRGGGYCPRQEMAIAAGGKIKQTVVPDPYSKDLWDKHATVTFNVQILNALSFYSVTGIPAPQTPVSAKTYQELGLLFFKMYEEPSNVSGNVRRGQYYGSDGRYCLGIVLLLSSKICRWYSAQASGQRRWRKRHCKSGRAHEVNGSEVRLTGVYEESN